MKIIKKQISSQTTWVQKMQMEKTIIILTMILTVCKIIQIQLILTVQDIWNNQETIFSQIRVVRVQVLETRAKVLRKLSKISILKIFQFFKTGTTKSSFSSDSLKMKTIIKVSLKNLHQTATSLDSRYIPKYSPKKTWKIKCIEKINHIGLMFAAFKSCHFTKLALEILLNLYFLQLILKNL